MGIWTKVNFFFNKENFAYFQFVSYSIFIFFYFVINLFLKWVFKRVCEYSIYYTI